MQSSLHCQRLGPAWELAPPPPLPLPPLDSAADWLTDALLLPLPPPLRSAPVFPHAHAQAHAQVHAATALRGCPGALPAAAAYGARPCGSGDASAEPWLPLYHGGYQALVKDEPLPLPLPLSLPLAEPVSVGRTATGPGEEALRELGLGRADAVLERDEARRPGRAPVQATVAAPSLSSFLPEPEPELLHEELTPMAVTLGGRKRPRALDKEMDGQRQARHRHVEQQRRKRFNEALNEVKDACGIGEVEKTVVLMRAAHQLREARLRQQECDRLKAENHALREAVHQASRASPGQVQGFGSTVTLLDAFEHRSETNAADGDRLSPRSDAMSRGASSCTFSDPLSSLYVSNGCLLMIMSTDVRMRDMNRAMQRFLGIDPSMTDARHFLSTRSLALTPENELQPCLEEIYRVVRGESRLVSIRKSLFDLAGNRHQVITTAMPLLDETTGLPHGLLLYVNPLFVVAHGEKKIPFHTT